MNNRTYLLKFLDFKTYNLYINNLRKFGKMSLLDDDYNPGIINASFTWDYTPESSTFWSRINDQLESCDEAISERSMLRIMNI